MLGKIFVALLTFVGCVLAVVLLIAFEAIYLGSGNLAFLIVAAFGGALHLLSFSSSFNDAWTLMVSCLQFLGGATLAFGVALAIEHMRGPTYAR